MVEFYKVVKMRGVIVEVSYDCIDEGKEGFVVVREMVGKELLDLWGRVKRMLVWDLVSKFELG